MKKFVFCLFSALILAQIVPSFGNQILTYSDKVPLNILEYYQDDNFISSFSTRSERNLLARYIAHKTLPDQLRRDERLDKVFKLMQKQDEKVMRVDPKMLIQRILPTRNFISSDLVEVDHVQHNCGEILVKISVYSLDHEINMLFISQYNEYEGDEGKISSEEERLKMARSSSIFSQAIHKWTLVEGRWLKCEVDIRLLKETRKI